MCAYYYITEVEEEEGPKFIPEGSRGFQEDGEHDTTWQRSPLFCFFGESSSQYEKRWVLLKVTQYRKEVVPSAPKSEAEKCSKIG